jgi:hypothetical protein
MSQNEHNSSIVTRWHNKKLKNRNPGLIPEKINTLQSCGFVEKFTAVFEINNSLMACGQ